MPTRIVRGPGARHQTAEDLAALGAGHVSSIKTISVSGTHYEMGRQHGLQVRELRPLIVEAIKAQFSRIEQDGPDERFQSLLRDTVALLQEADPPILEMIRGQAEGLEIEFETLLRYGLVTYLRDVLATKRLQGDEGCTTWAASGPATDDEKPILVKNRDSGLEHLPLQLVVRAVPKVGYGYAYVTSAGSPGIFCAGINEAGLAIADTHVCSTDIGPGLPDYSLMMHILEEHGRVRSALDYLRSVARMGRNNLILADAGGDLVVFEIGHKNHGLIEAENHILVNTNHFVSSSLKDHFVDISPPALRGNSFHRYERVKRELEDSYGRTDAALAKRLMAWHGGPLDSLCRHQAPNWPNETLSTTIFLPAGAESCTRPSFQFCNGRPCQAAYEDFTI